MHERRQGPLMVLALHLATGPGVNNPSPSYRELSN